MAKKRIIKVGDRFGKLTIIKEVEPNITPCGTKQRKFLCKCECGNEVVRAMSTLSNGAKTSCGCDKSSYIQKYYNDDDTRPDGASVTLNNGRGTITWDSKTKTWNKI